MRVGIDTNGLFTGQGGVARYIRGLMSGLASIHAPDLETFPIAWEVENHSYRQPARALKTIYREAVWSIMVAPHAIRSHGTDLFHATGFPLAIVPRDTKKVVTIHDMAVFRYPERYRRWQRWSGPYRLRAATRYDHLICDSKFTADETIRCLGIPASLIEVVHLGCDFTSRVAPAEAAPTFALPTEFYLFVGSLEPVKNLCLLRATYEAAAVRDISLPPLVIVGSRWLGVEGEGKPPSNWLYAGRQSDAVLAYLYRRAIGLVFPSKYEGFGIPLLEAMALGCPVICSPVSSLLEVGGDGPLYADLSPQAYSERMVQLAQDQRLRERHIAAGFDRASAFSWQRCADQTVEVYRSVL